MKHPLPEIANRRTGPRFALRLALRCREIEPWPLDQIIVGESLNVSSKGLLFSSSQVFLEGQALEVLIEWPVLLDNRVRLTLAADGVVVRSSGGHTAMSIKKYQFRTRGSAG